MECPWTYGIVQRLERAMDAVNGFLGEPGFVHDFENLQY
jgi:hypothetical protein